MTVRRVDLVKYESYHGIFINNLTAYFTNVDRKPKPQDRRQIQLDLSDLAQIETQLNNSFWKNKKRKRPWTIRLEI